MAVTLLPNQAPPGTRKGSPITIVDTFTDNGQTRSTCAVPISDKAIPGQDVVVAIMGFAHDGFGHFLGSFGETPSPALNNDANVQDAPTSNGTAQSKWFSRVVQPGDPGRDFNFSWSADVFVSWALIVYTLRYVDLGQIYDTGFFFNFSVADIIFSSTLAGVYNTNTDNALIISQITAEAGPVNTGIGPGPLPGWYNLVDANSGQQPNLGVVSGIVDMPTAGRWLGASCAWSQGNPGSFGAPCDFAAITVAMKPMPAPGAPGLTLSPAGGSIDAASISGVPFGLTVRYTPVRGQGPQEALFVARQPHAGGTIQHLNMDTQSWQATEYANLGAAPSMIFAPGLWADDGTNWDLYVGIRESSLHYKSALASLTFTADPPPAVTSVTTTSPNSATPTIGWTTSFTKPAAVQTVYRIKLYALADTLVPGFNPTNLVPAGDSDFESGIGGWLVNLNCALSSSSAWSLTGTKSLAMTATAGGDMIAVSKVAGVPVIPNQIYTMGAYFRAATTGRSCAVRIEWWDANGAYIGAGAWGASVTDAVSGTGSGTKALATSVAPANAAFANLDLKVISAAASEVHDVDVVTLAATPAPAYDSGPVTSASGSAVTGTLTGGLDYVPYVQITQTGGQTSPWVPVTNGSYTNAPVGATFFNNRANPSVPTLVATPGTVPLTGAPQVNLALSGSATTALVEYSDDQVTWYTVRDGATGALATAVTLAGSPTIYDREAPPGATRYYRATGYTAGARSDRTASQPAVAPLGQFWLRRPLTGDGMLLKIETSGGFKVKYPEDATQYPIGGRRNVVTIAEAPIHGAVITFTAMFTDQGSWDAFKVMREKQETLLLQSDMAGKQWFVRIEPEPEYDLKLTGSRLAGKPRRTLPLVLTEQDRP